MVGVPRSSGCRICVQRRVRCDGARPTCNNCRKGNRPCPGYGPGVKFQDEGPKLREKYQKGQKQLGSSDGEDDPSFWAMTPSSGSSSEESSPFAHIPTRWNAIGQDVDLEAPTRINMFGFVEGKMKAYFELDLFDILTEQAPLQNPFNPEPFGTFDPWTMLTKPVLSPSTQQLQLLSNFTQTLTPSTSGSAFLPKAMRSQGTWLSHLPGLSGANLLLDSAIRAVTLVHIGRLHKNEVFVMESRPYYGKALRLLNVAITDEEMGMDNKTLCATILLSFYEMFASDNDASWVRHAGGAGTLMRLRGAKRHRYGFDRDIFMAYRHTLVIEALSNDVPSFLDEPEWRQVSKDIYTDLVKSNQIPANRIGVLDVAEEFYSLMATISVISAKAFRLNSKITEFGATDSGEILTTYQQLTLNYEALQRLFKRWLVALKSIGHLPPLEPVDDPVIPLQYRYTNVFIASFNVGFWTTLMLIDNVRYPLAKLLGKPTERIAQQSEAYAVESCQSVDFMLTSSFLGPFFTIYALRFAHKAFQTGDVRKDWALCKLVDIGDRRMMFAKGAIIIDGDVSERPENLFEPAQQRLREYNLSYRMMNQVEQMD